MSPVQFFLGGGVGFKRWSENNQSRVKVGMILLNGMLTWIVLKLSIFWVGKLRPGRLQEFIEWRWCA